MKPIARVSVPSAAIASSIGKGTRRASTRGSTGFFQNASIQILVIE